MFSRSRNRELWLFLSVGAAVACCGQAILSLLVAAGWPAGLANAAQLALTLQLNFLANHEITWKGRLRGYRGIWQRWRRFQVARAASAVVCVATFPIVAPAIGTSAAYWLLLAVATAVNFWSDSFWSFSAIGTTSTVRPHRPNGRVRRLTSVLGTAVAGLSVAALAALFLDQFLDQFIVMVSLFMLVVAATTLAFQLYKWWRPEHNDTDRYGQPDEPRLPGVILVPMRHEEAVAGQTLERLATLRHPDYRVVPIVDHADDPGTARIIRAKAREHDNILICPYPEDADVHNKPIALNAAVEMLDETGVPFEWIGVADAEDLFHADLLRLVDYRFRKTEAGIVQCGVQLMNFSSRSPGTPLRPGRLARLRRWWRANATAWWRVSNVLEYFKWFQSRLKLQARIRVMPLGGNSVFFRRRFLDDLRARHGAYWDQRCLTEDCQIGIRASILGYRVDVVYIAAMVTREETPETLGAWVRQRVRWMQGFLQVFFAGEWLALPSLTQRVLAVYVLGFQFFQAFAAVVAPVALALALVHKSPTLVALLATIPLAIGLLNVMLDVLMLTQFGRTFGERPRLRDYAGLVIGAYPYQVMLSVAAVWAIARFALGRNTWVKTTHLGAHLPEAGRSGAPAATTAERVP